MVGSSDLVLQFVTSREITPRFCGKSMSCFHLRVTTQTSLPGDFLPDDRKELA